MFLDRLNDKEKEMFLDVAVYTAQANGVIEDTEKDLILQYCREMTVAFYDISKLHPLDEIIEVFSKTPKEKKRIVILEILTTIILYLLNLLILEALGLGQMIREMNMLMISGLVLMYLTLLIEVSLIRDHLIIYQK